MKVAVVTGGGRGLGRAFARALAAQGHAVAVVARSEAELAETVRQVEVGGGHAKAFVADVTDVDAVDEVVSGVEQALGAIDVLVNNAGIAGPIGPLLTSTIADWWRALEVNLKGQVICAYRVLPGMVSRRQGRIINVASGGGAYMLPNFSAYITSKTALIRFAECLAAEVKDAGVSVFAMGPGTVRTAMSEYSLNSPEGRKWLPWFRPIFDEGRDLPPERPAELVVTLASGRADALTGRFIRPDDDIEKLLASPEAIAKANLYTLQVPRL